MLKNKKFWAKIIFVVVLLAIIAYTFRDSAGPIFKQLSTTSFTVLVAICISSVLYHLMEARITQSLARRYNPNIKYRRMVCCAFYCSFYRLATLGSGSGVAAIYFLGKSGVEYSKGAGLYMVQYVLHKSSIALFSGVLFLINWKFMMGHYREYAGYLLAAYALTAVIAAALILFVISVKFHWLLFKLGGIFNRSGKLDHVLETLRKNCDIMETSTAELLKDKKVLIINIGRNLIKFCFWYGIPFLVLFGTGELTLLHSLAVTSLAVMTAAVIPTPAGIGSVEVIMTSLIGVLVGIDRGGAITFLYRFATFIFPFFIGGAYVLYRRWRGKMLSRDEKMLE